jgi:hypothetical protein
VFQRITGNCFLVSFLFFLPFLTFQICSYVYQQQITEQKVVDDEDEIPEKPQMKFHLECNGPIQSRVILQPSSLDSDVHTRMALKLSDKMKRDKKSVLSSITCLFPFYPSFFFLSVF